MCESETKCDIPIGNIKQQIIDEITNCINTYKELKTKYFDNLIIDKNDALNCLNNRTELNNFLRLMGLTVNNKECPMPSLSGGSINKKSINSKLLINKSQDKIIDDSEILISGGKKSKKRSKTLINDNKVSKKGSKTLINDNKFSKKGSNKGSKTLIGGKKNQRKNQIKVVKKDQKH